LNGLERVVSAPPPGVLNRQLIEWVDGAPVVKTMTLITAPQIKDLHAASLTQIYSEPYDDLAIEMGLPPSRFYGMTLLEVMLIKRAENAARSGDSDEVERILDRELGKPKTTAEVHSVSETYEQACLRIARAEEAKRVASAKVVVVDADVVEDEPWTQL
jgi:hypothetical protein